MSNATKRPPVTRSLQPAPRIDPEVPVIWEDSRGTQLRLTLDITRTLFPQKHPLTDTELLLFLHTARSMRANPFLNEIYPIKYASNSRAAIVLGYHYFMQRAKDDPRYGGFELWYVDGQGKRIQDGLETKEKVVAAICVVHMQGEMVPTKFVARVSEFKKERPGDDNPWNSMPVHMIGKCAVGNAHRQAIPSLSGMHLQEEVGQGYVKEPEVDVDALESARAENGEGNGEEKDWTPPPPPPPEARDLCPVHKLPWEHKVGTSKAGKPYDFWGCSGKVNGGYCKERPPEGYDGPQEAQSEAQAPAPPPSDADAPAPAPAAETPAPAPASPPAEALFPSDDDEQAEEPAAAAGPPDPETMSDAELAVAFAGKLRASFPGEAGPKMGWGWLDSQAEGTHWPRQQAKPKSVVRVIPELIKADRPAVLAAMAKLGGEAAQ